MVIKITSLQEGKSTKNIDFYSNNLSVFNFIGLFCCKLG